MSFDSFVQLVVDGYDLRAERERSRDSSEAAADRPLERDSASIEVHADMDPPRLREVRAEHARSLLPNTLAGELSPVLELGWPRSGHFVACEAGVYFDAYLGVAQKLFDEQHPRYREMLRAVVDSGLILQREINTDDYLALREGSKGLVTPQQLAALICEVTAMALPAKAPYAVFLSNSGTEAVEATLKVAYRNCHHRLVQRYGADVEAALMTQLGIARDPAFANEVVYEDYPFFVFACEGAFHGRTLGSLQATCSKAVHKRGYPRPRWVQHLPFNGKPDDLARRVDSRALPDVLTADGGVRGCLEAGRVPRDLCAAFLFEGFQGEGGYRIAERDWLHGLAATCQEHEILLCADEVQSFARTGTTYFVEQLGVEPDVIAVAKAAGIGATIARKDLEEALPTGWHSNTWGGGKIFDVQYAYATWDLWHNGRDPLFEGRNYADNLRIKGEYLRSGLAYLAQQHPETLVEFQGVGGMFGLTVRKRDELIREGWRRGLKLLGCGPAGEESRLRLVLLADVRTHEVDVLVDGLDRLFALVGSSESTHESTEDRGVTG